MISIRQTRKMGRDGRFYINMNLERCGGPALPVVHRNSGFFRARVYGGRSSAASYDSSRLPNSAPTPLGPLQGESEGVRLLLAHLKRS